MKRIDLMTTIVWLAIVACVTGCWRGPDECSSSDDCFVGESCESGLCMPVGGPGSDAGLDGAMPDGAMPDGAMPDGGLPDGGLPDGGVDPGCPAAQPRKCDGFCVDPQTDPGYCGACDVSCGDDQTCRSGQCVDAGDCRQQGCSGLSWCDTATGQCEPGCADDDQCGANESCDTSTHECVCDQGFHACGDDGCVPDDDVATCGDRCTPCPEPVGGSATCEAGSCSVSCAQGYELCGGTCSECPTGAGIATTGCGGNSCVISTCEAGWTSCDTGCCELDDAETCPIAVARAREAGTTQYFTNLDLFTGTTVELDGSGSYARRGTLTDYDWSIIDQPMASTSQLVPNASDVSPTLSLDVPGVYVLELVVRTGAEASCEASRVTLEAVPAERDVRVRLTWDTPADPDQTDDVGADVDIHYLQDVPTAEWDEPPHDIFWRNPTADWGPVGAEGDPSLDIDDVDGRGPEVITHSGLEDRDYWIGVHYYKDNGFGPSYATIHIFVDDVLTHELRNTYLASEFTFWRVGHIDGETLSFTPDTSANNPRSGFPGMAP